jgi:cbb3-type cytochrome oxidase cytochrome c subunit
LTGLAERRSPEWIAGHFKNPAAVVPGSPMPPLNLPAAETAALSSFLLAATPESARAASGAPAWARQGATLYVEQECGICHIVNGAGQTVGPPLNGVGARRDREWIVGHFRDPQSFSPGSIMPPYELSDEEMDAIVEYLLALPAQ